MTPTTARKVAELSKNIAKYMTEVKAKGDTPFATSAAKYYPALKKLASK